MPDLRSALTAFLAAQLPAGAAPRVSDPVNSGGGSSKVNWAFDAEWYGPDGPVAHALMLRQQPAAGVVDTDLGQEFALLKALARTGLPTPAARWADLRAEFFEVPSVVVERRPGRAHRGVLRDKDPFQLGPSRRVTLAGSLADLLAATHAVDVAGFQSLLGTPRTAPAVAELRRWEDELDAEDLDPRGRLTPVRAWLHNHVPDAPAKVVLVHGDFRPANVLVDDGRISALLDWELAHLGDAADDLGWYTCSVYRTEHFPQGWSVADFLAHYGDSGGEVPDTARLRFWQVLSVFRLAVIALRGARNVELGRATGPPPPADKVVAAALHDLGQSGELRD